MHRGRVILKPTLAALNNEDRAGRPLIYQTGVTGALERVDAAAATILAVGGAAKPERLEYALRGAEKHGRQFSGEEELKRFIGIREFTRTWPDLGKRGYDAFAAKNTVTHGQANKVLGENLPGDQVKATTEANAAIEAELQSYEADLRSLGVPEAIVRKARTDSSVPNKFSPLAIDPEFKNRVITRK